MKILVVCEANKGRSASLAAHLKELIKAEGRQGIEVDSAGISESSTREFEELAKSGKVPEHIIMGAEPRIKQAMLKRGATAIGEHRVKLITPDLIRSADLVLAVNPDIIDALKARFGQHAKKIMTARGFVTEREHAISRRRLSIDDAWKPIGKRGLYKGKAQAKSMRAAWGVTGETGRLARAIIRKIK